MYFFKKGSAILYIGKATSLRSRVKSYFSKDLVLTRGAGIVKMIGDSTKVDFKITSSVLEALILEAYLIKKHKTIYNIRERDDKSFNTVVVTKERFPKLVLVRGKELPEWEGKMKTYFGPFPNGRELGEAIKLVRRIFPYRGRKCVPCSEQKNELLCKPCFERQIKLCPGVCTGEVNARQYAHIIRNITLLFEGKTDRLIKKLTRQMNGYARNEQFEKAAEMRNQIFGLTHVKDISLIKDRVRSMSDGSEFRIEAYDISHISGTHTVGVMTVIVDGYPAKHEYRKFKIKGDFKDTAHDLANLAEVLTRRVGHEEWRTPDLVVIDGGEVHRRHAENVLKNYHWNVPVVSVVKDERHRPKDIMGESKVVRDYRREILLANSEAHRFALAFHDARRTKAIRGEKK